MKIVLVLAASLFLFGCDKPYSAGEISASKKIVKNRELYAKDILHAMNDCIKSSSTLTHLAAAGNDQDEVVEECYKASQLAYGAYSPFYESDLQRMAAK